MKKDSVRECGRWGEDDLAGFLLPSADLDRPCETFRSMVELVEEEKVEEDICIPDICVVCSSSRSTLPPAA